MVDQFDEHADDAERHYGQDDVRRADQGDADQRLGGDELGERGRAADPQRLDAPHLRDRLRPGRHDIDLSVQLLRLRVTAEDGLRGAAVWAAYGAVEALFAIVLRRALFGAALVLPDDRYTLFLLILYPLVGALLGRFAMAGLAIAFAANAVAVIGGHA